MAGCPATTSGRLHADCSWQGRGLLPSSRLISGPALRRLQAAAPVPDRNCRRRRGCATCSAATMAEEMVAEPRSAERRQIQQMLNRYTAYSLEPSRAIRVQIAKNGNRKALFAGSAQLPLSQSLVCEQTWCFSPLFPSISLLLCAREYKPGFTTLIESDTFAKGLDETVVRAISAKKREPVRRPFQLPSAGCSTLCC